MSRPSRGTRQVLVCSLITVGALLVAGCTPAKGPEGSSEPSSSEAPEAATEAVAEGPVQDTWVYERIRTVQSDGEIVDVTEDILAGVEVDDANSIELLDGVTFSPLIGDSTSIHSARYELREDLDVVAGITRNDGHEALQIIATPTGEHSIDAGDLIDLDLLFLGLAPGAPIIVDFAFGQGLPGDGDDSSSGPELLAARMNDGRFHWHGEVDDGELDVGLQTVFGSVSGASSGVANTSGTRLDDSTAGQVSDALYRPEEMGAVTMSTRQGRGGGIPAKAKPALKPIDELAGCKKSPLKCLSDYFKNMRKGTEKSLDDLFNRNMSPDPTPPPPVCRFICGGGSGEPHIMTFDSHRYDLQLVGEFVFADSDAATVQVRTTPAGSNEFVSVIAAVAVEAGGHRFSVVAGRDEPVWLDGEPVADPQEPTDLTGGGQAYEFGNDFIIETPSDTTVTIRRVHGTYFDVVVDAGPASGDWQGLLGSPDGDKDNDMSARDGQALSLEASVEEIYEEFAETWRLTDAESLFDYGAGENTAFFTDASFPRAHPTIDDLPEPRRAVAETLCTLAGISNPTQLEWCIFDYAMTGDINFIESAWFAHSTYDGPAEDWITPIPGVDNNLSRAILDGTGQVLVQTGALEATEEESSIVALDRESGEINWQVGMGKNLCIEVTDSGTIAALTSTEDGDHVVQTLNPADGSTESTTPTGIDGCDDAAVSGEVVLFNHGEDVFGYDAEDEVISFETQIAGLVSPPVVSADGSVWTAAMDDDVAYAVEIDLPSGDIDRTELPVDKVLGNAAPTEHGFVAGYLYDGEDGGGVLRFTPESDEHNSGAQVTPLPNTHEGLEFSRVPQEMLSADENYFAGYMSSGEVAVFDVTTGEPLQIIEPTSFNNNGGAVLVHDGLVIVGTFGGTAWVEAYSAGTGELKWSSVNANDLPQIDEHEINDAKVIGPMTDTGQVIVQSTTVGGIGVALIGSGE